MRIALTDGSGNWFDDDAAVKFGEEKKWDGRNMVSVHTGDNHYHEELYYSKGGKWILNQWSNWQGTSPTYDQITEESAIKWLILNENFEDEDLEGLPENIKQSVKAGIQAAEI